MNIIVGAGLSGLYLAKKLKEKGFENIVIFEKSNHIGGRILSHVQPNGQIVSLGAGVGRPNDFLLKNLCTEFGFNLNISKPKVRYINGLKSVDTKSLIDVLIKIYNDVFAQGYFDISFRQFSESYLSPELQLLVKNFCFYNDFWET